MAKHKLLDLFSGIGGFSLAADRFGIETIAFVEKEPFCQKVLKKHWGDVPIIDDIRKVKGEDYDSATIVSGGFPCQPFSVAGKQKGTDDDRYLWDETIRVVAECKPRWFIGENVDGLVNIQNGMVLRQVQDDLEKEGFQVQCLVIPASGVGAWHQRKRIWIIAYSEHNGSFATKEQRGNTQTSTGSQKRENSSLQSERASRPTDNGDVSNTNSSLRRGRATISQGGENKIWGFHFKEEKQNQSDLWSQTIRCDVVSGEQEDVSNSQNRSREQTQWQGRESIGRGKQDVSYTNTKRLQGHNSEQQLSEEELRFTSSKDDEKQYTWWETQSNICGVPDGVSYGLDKGRVGRIKSLGNSIVPQIAEQIFRSIIDAE